ncbi:hypothetical protein FJT64_016129 [Amphibalanus amphitrite]|uniref:Uncharacterized protein n=1 Tax=Amphibalanus amphitrite TaxID=1232801 RepID=A0A6A4XFI4_AMPAM|nr:hypothetical protein FJT64_016129 [Amphibalanus amphitrite]
MTSSDVPLSPTERPSLSPPDPCSLSSVAVPDGRGSPGSRRGTDASDETLAPLPEWLRLHQRPRSASVAPGARGRRLSHFSTSVVAPPAPPERCVASRLCGTALLVLLATAAAAVLYGYLVGPAVGARLGSAMVESGTDAVPAAVAGRSPSPRSAGGGDRSGMTIPLGGSPGTVGRRRHPYSSGAISRQTSVGYEWVEPAGRAGWSGSAEAAELSRPGRRSPRLSPSSARDLHGHWASAGSVAAPGSGGRSRGISTSAGQLGRSPGASPHSSRSCSHSTELGGAAAPRRRPRDLGGDPARRSRPRGGPGGRPPRRRIQLERQALSLDGKPRSSQAQRRRQATLLRQTTVEVPDCAYLPRLDLESAALGRSGPRSSGALSQRSSGVLRQSTQDTKRGGGATLAAPMLPVLAMAVQRRTAAARGHKKRASRRMRWVVIATGLVLLLISVGMIGITLRMAPMIDDMVLGRGRRRSPTIVQWEQRSVLRFQCSTGVSHSETILYKDRGSHGRRSRWKGSTGRPRTGRSRSRSRSRSREAALCLPDGPEAPLSRSLLALPPNRHSARRHSEPWHIEMEHQALRLGLFLDDPVQGGRRSGRPRRHSATPSTASERHRRASRSPSGLGVPPALAELLPSGASTPKERRRRWAVLVTLVATAVLLLLAVSLVLGTLHFSELRSRHAGAHGQGYGLGRRR